MSQDSYRIIITISHHRITFEYWQRDGENRLVPMPNGNWPTPLAFYISSTGMIIGEEAARAVHQGTDNAFDNYFGRLAGDEKYTIGGERRDIRFLLLDAAESIFESFFRNTLLNVYGSLSENRANMPLIIACEPDVKPNERALLQGMFKNSGYGRSKVVDYNSFIGRYIHESISRQYVCDNVLVTWIENGNLSFTLFNANQAESTEEKQHAIFEGLGIDPRHDYVCNLLRDDLLGQNPWIQIEKEADIIANAASDFLNSTAPMQTLRLSLSDGQQYQCILRKTQVDYILTNGDNSIRTKLDEFLRNNGIENRNRTLLLLRGDAANNDYFECKLNQGFSHTIKSDRQLRNSVKSLLLSWEISNTPKDETLPLPPPPPAHDKLIDLRRQWRQVSAEAKGKIRSGQTAVAAQMLKDFLAQCNAVSGSEFIINDAQELLDSVKSSGPSIQNSSVTAPPTVNPQEIKALERLWREVKAKANGKKRFGNIAEAKDLLQEFAKKNAKACGVDHLQQAVNEELAGLNAIPDTCRSANPTAKSADKRSIKRPKEKANTTDSSANLGLTLIQQGKLKDARDWYRQENDTAKANVLSTIIRLQRGVEMRKQTLDTCRKSKNKEQINRIINELDEYIDLCDNAGVDATEYKQLKLDYKKI